MVTIRAKALILFALGALAAGCRPDLDDRVSIVDAPRILAIRAEPAEARPGAAVSYAALVGQGPGAEGPPPLRWSFCTARKPLAELGPVSSACLDEEPGSLAEIGDGPVVDAVIPKDACRTFGPEVPAPKPGEPAARPVDPDSSGGFFQPVLLRSGAEGAISLEQSRIGCGIAGVTPDVLAEFQRRYVVNANPALAAVSMALGDHEIELRPGDPVGEGNRVPAGATVRLRASWPACGSAPCEGAEPYVVFDPERRALVERHESIRIAWFATDGEFDHDRTGREAGGEPFTDNEWIAPGAPGPVRLWVVIRDDRGGVGWLDYVVDVR
ncbi:MAG TPA: hypothetical protein VGD74_07475 [Vulgatibacter sp.]